MNVRFVDLLWWVTLLALGFLNGWQWTQHFGWCS